MQFFDILFSIGMACMALIGFALVCDAMREVVVPIRPTLKSQQLPRSDRVEELGLQSSYRDGADGVALT
jgi:hypothetical protein